MCSRIQKLTVVLASASPRRTELLEQGNIKHVVMPSHCEEVITSQVPGQVVEELSVQKAEDVYQQYETENTGDFLVIGSDTVVAADGKILGKPKDKEEAYQMISMLQGKAHQVYTGVTLLIKKDGKKIRKTFHECSECACISDGQGRNPGIYCDRRADGQGRSLWNPGRIWRVYPWD